MHEGRFWRPSGCVSGSSAKPINSIAWELHLIAGTSDVENWILWRDFVEKKRSATDCHASLTHQLM